MKIKFKPTKVSNVSIALCAAGTASLAAGIIKSQTWDKSHAPVVEVSEGEGTEIIPASGIVDKIKGANKVTLGLEVTGGALIIAGVAKAIADVRKTNKALAADDELPPVADPTAIGEG